MEYSIDQAGRAIHPGELSWTCPPLPPVNIIVTVVDNEIVKTLPQAMYNPWVTALIIVDQENAKRRPEKAEKDRNARGDTMSSDVQKMLSKERGNGEKSDESRKLGGEVQV